MRGAARGRSWPRRPSSSGCRASRSAARAAEQPSSTATRTPELRGDARRTAARSRAGRAARRRCPDRRRAIAASLEWPSYPGPLAGPASSRAHGRARAHRGRARAARDRAGAGAAGCGGLVRPPPPRPRHAVARVDLRGRAQLHADPAGDARRAAAARRRHGQRVRAVERRSRPDPDAPSQPAGLRRRRPGGLSGRELGDLRHDRPRRAARAGSAST